MRRKPRCFIAIAFGHRDTDAIYQRYIEPVVSKLGFTPRRADNIVHNDFIDRKIIEEIESADICIADLTYARPSVYFEAGYAQRKVPVLYTCRKDHLKNTDDALKVHFDLRQRKIVDWENENDTGFKARFKKQLTHSARQILLDAERANKIKKERLAFAKLSTHEKFRKISEKLKQILATHSYKRQTYKPRFLPNHDTIDPQFLPLYSFYYKQDDTTLIIIQDIFPLSLTGVIQQAPIIARNIDRLLREIKVPPLKGVTTIRNINFIISLNRISTNQITRALPYFKQPAENYYTDISPIGITIEDQKFLQTTEFVFFPNIISTTEISDKFNALIKLIHKK